MTVEFSRRPRNGGKWDFVDSRFLKLFSRIYEKWKIPKFLEIFYLFRIKYFPDSLEIYFIEFCFW